MTDPAESGPGALRRVLQGLPATQRRSELIRQLASRAKHFLSLPTTDAVLPSIAWLDLGFDSLRAVDFRTEIEAHLALPLQRRGLSHDGGDRRR